MTDARNRSNGADMRTADGRVPGRRGRATRRRLLDTTHDLLSELPYRDLKVAAITRRAGTSPATFYQYFPDVESAVLVLATEVADEGATRLQALVEGPDWSEATDAHDLADGFLELFERERALLRVVDLAALEGDERFRTLRTRLLNGVFLSLRDVVHGARARELIDPATDPAAAAGVLTSMLAHVAAHRPGLEALGTSREQLCETMAAVVDWSVRGSQPG